jgi:hypothetical protein
VKWVVVSVFAFALLEALHFPLVHHHAKLPPKEEDESESMVPEEENVVNSSGHIISIF